MANGGIIYELRFNSADGWIPFYVGYTNNQRRRLSEHRNSAKVGMTLVYRTIRECFVPGNIEWDMFPVLAYEGDHIDQEYEHLMYLLTQGVTLTNEKKGNKNWMERQIVTANKMKENGFTSFKKYMEFEKQQAIAYQKHQQWLAQEETNNAIIANMAEQELERRRKAVLDKANQRVLEQRELQNVIEAEKRQKQERREKAIREARAQQRAEWEAEQKRIRDEEQEKIDNEKRKEREEKRKALDEVTTRLSIKYGVMTAPTPSNAFDDLFEERK